VFTGSTFLGRFSPAAASPTAHLGNAAEKSDTGTMKWNDVEHHSLFLKITDIQTFSSTNINFCTLHTY
jgi:hypothetical protein